MEVDDLIGTWVFKSKPVDGCEIQCPEFKEWSHHLKWKSACVYCEDCGDHSAIQCPSCDEPFDHVWSPTFDVRK